MFRLRISYGSLLRNHFLVCRATLPPVGGELRDVPKKNGPGLQVTGCSLNYTSRSVPLSVSLRKLFVTLGLGFVVRSFIRLGLQ